MAPSMPASLVRATPNQVRAPPRPLLQLARWRGLHSRAGGGAPGRHARAAVAPPPLEDGRFAGRLPGDWPASVGLLVGLHPVEMTLDLGCAEERSPAARRGGRNVKGRESV